MVVLNLALVVGKTTKGVEWTKQLLQEYHDVFPAYLPNGVPPDQGASFRIELLPRAKPTIK